MNKLEARLRQIPIMSIEDKFRFYGKYEKKESGCWEWLGYIPKDGHPTFSIMDEEFSASRIAWFLEHGEPGNIFVLHECNNGKCVNVAHLYLGTQKQNMQQVAQDQRRNCFGELNNRAKLLNPQVHKVRELANNGVRKKEIATRFNVAESTIYKILQGRAYATV